MSRYTAPKGGLLKDSSWIRKANDEDEDIDRDANFGISVLSHSTSDTPGSPETEQTGVTKRVRTSTSVQDLTRRFSGLQDDQRGSTLPTSKSTSSYTKSTYSSLKSGSPKTTTTTVTKDGTTETTITTTTQTLKSTVTGSPTQTFTERVKSSSKEPQYSSYSPSKSTKVTETTVITNEDAENQLYDSLIPPSIQGDLSPTDSKTTISTIETVTVTSSADNDAEDKLYNTLIPASIKSDLSPTDSKTTVFTTETVTVKSSGDVDDIKTTTTTRTSSTAEDDLYSTLLPKAITSGLSSPVSSSSSSIKRREIVTVESSRGVESPILPSPTSTRRTSSYSSYSDESPSIHTTSYTISTKPSEDYSSEHKSYSYSRPDSSFEYSKITSPTTYSSSQYRSSRPVLEKDLCTSCRKPFTGDAKMVLDDMKINCHASCFKCQVCNCTLGNMKAGDYLWVYNRLVHCENCFETTREKWRR